MQLVITKAERARVVIAAGVHDEDVQEFLEDPRSVNEEIASRISRAMTACGIIPLAPEPRATAKKGRKG
jgi:hypothetical protein